MKDEWKAIILATCQIDNKYIETFLNRGIKLLMIDRMILEENSYRLFQTTRSLL